MRNDVARQLAKALKDKPDAYIECRDPGIRHAWSVVNDMHLIRYQLVGNKKLVVAGRDSQCGRCATQKSEHFLVTSHGLEKVFNRYSYPEDYAIRGVPRGIKQASIVWQETYRRAMVRAAHAEPGERETADS